MWELDHNKGEHRRIDAFELWCWRRLLRVPWTTRRPNQSILKEINPEYLLERLMLKLKLQCFGHLMWREDLDAGENWGQEKKGVTENEMVEWHHWLSGREFEQTPGDSEGQGSLAYCSLWGCKESDLGTEQQQCHIQPCSSSWGYHKLVEFVIVHC